MQIQSPPLNPFSSIASSPAQRVAMKKPAGPDLTIARPDLQAKPKPLLTMPMLTKPMISGLEKPLAAPKPHEKPHDKPMEIRPDAVRSRSKPHIESDTPRPTVQVPPAPPPLPPGQNPPLTMQGLMDAWGQSDSPYDLNSDGTVNVNDLLMFINNWEKFGPQNQNQNPSAPGGPPPASAPGSGGVSPPPAATILDRPDSPRSPSPATLERDKLATRDVSRRSQSLYDHLSVAGFADKPPVNIRELVDAINPSPRQADLMMQQLATKYPDGLRVNVVG